MMLDSEEELEEFESAFEVNNEVPTFVINNQDHPQISEIHAELKRQSMQMHHRGYVPDTKFVLHDVEEEEVFCLHHRTRN